MKLRVAIALLVVCAGAFAQPRPGPGRGPAEGPPASGLWAAPPGKWWDNPEMRARLGITADQQKKMDDVFQQSRLKLIDLHAALEKEEATLEPMINGATLDDSKLLPQIDRVVQARAELEKAHARLLLGIRHVLTQDQWTLLEREQPRPPRPDGPPQPARPPRK